MNNFRIAMLAVCAGYLLAPLSLAAVTVAIPSLAADLQASATKVGWLPTIYILSNVAFLLPAGRLADIYGRKRMYSLGIALTAVSSIMCAVASNIDWLLFWRFWQGIAGAMTFGSGIAIVGSIVPDHKRGKALGIIAACVYLGLTLAPAFGGYVTEWLNWRAVFYIPVPLMLLLLVFIQLFMHGEWKQHQASRFDKKGSFLLAVSVSLFAWGLGEYGSMLGYCLLVLSIACMVGFVVHQSKSSKPLIRVQLIVRNRVFGLSLASSFFMYASNFAILFLLSLYLQYVLRYTPVEAGNLLLVQALGMALMAPIAGALSDRLQPRLVATMGCVVVAVGLYLLNQLNPSASGSYVAMSLAFVGIGFGLFSTPNNNAIMGALDKNDVGVASSAMNLSRTIGNMFGMSVVNMLIAYYFGEQEITYELTGLLELTVSRSLQLALVFVAFAIACSAMRGKQQ